MTIFIFVIDKTFIPLQKKLKGRRYKKLYILGLGAVKAKKDNTNRVMRRGKEWIRSDVSLM